MGFLTMYTTDSQGVLNAYASELPTYLAEYPSVDQQRQYALQGAFAILLVTFTLLTAFAVS